MKDAGSGGGESLRGSGGTGSAAATWGMGAGAGGGVTAIAGVSMTRAGLAGGGVLTTASGRAYIRSTMALLFSTRRRSPLSSAVATT